MWYKGGRPSGWAFPRILFINWCITSDVTLVVGLEQYLRTLLKVLGLNITVHYRC